MSALSTRVNGMTITDLAALAGQAYHGDRFFQNFYARHCALLSVDSNALRARGGAVARADVVLVLRLWAGQLNKPTKKKRTSIGMPKRGIAKTPGALASEKKLTLYDQALRALADPLTLNVSQAVSVALAWDHVLNECGKRLMNAEESEHWNEDANAERAARWGSRHDALSAHQSGAIVALLDHIEGEEWSDFIESVAGLEELDCE